MTTVGQQIQSASDVICQNIESLSQHRSLLSQNILSQLRNLVEGAAVLIYGNSQDAAFQYDAVGPAIAFAKSKAKYNFLSRFHGLLQKSASHFTLDGDASERLMLKYYEYLHRVRSLLEDEFEILILKNLEKFPVDLDPSLREYHEKIAARIELAQSTTVDRSSRERYYIHKTRPFFVRGRIFYEITFCRAINKVSKFDRVIAFTHIDMTDKYAAMLTLKRDSIEVLGQRMPITIVREWEVSIRPCEFQNFARLLGHDITARAGSTEYQYLMRLLTASSGSLIDLIELPDDQYARVKAEGTTGGTKPLLFPVLDEARQIIRNGSAGGNVLRYLMLRMHNQTLKPQYDSEGCNRLSGLRLKYGCIPFDTMPLCTSLPGHNPRYWDLIESIDASGRTHELLARRVKNNVERHGMLYTPQDELERFKNVAELVNAHNQKLYYKHTQRQIVLDKGHAFIRGYEDETVSIVEKIKEYAASGIHGYTQAVERWLAGSPREIDDPVKKAALQKLFSHSRVALIYGAAGTGKSTMVDHIARYFNDKEKLFLAHTNPAIDNLKRKVTAQNSEFRTISSHVSRRVTGQEFDVLVVDECSTVSNAHLIEVLEKTAFKLLVLVGDVYQIESIEFGNWFGIIRAFVPTTSVSELTTPFRTKSQSLLAFWNKVRGIEDDIAEVISRNGYSAMLDRTLFEPQGNDEIILCLNYDGLYGINNINRFLQSSTRQQAVAWREATYKVGDPVLFHETERFRPVIYNNLKGVIVGIERIPGRIQFDVELDRPLSDFDVVNEELEWVGGSVVRFTVYESARASDEDDDSLNTNVPFQVAYAVSIHKAQGLEYDSVKIVITDANEDDITHSIFYTAVTRARERLKIFWTPETQQSVLSRLHRNSNQKDVALLGSRRGLKPVSN
jgi:energy-coupling factor transporter ATP-binding protein EcfA2